MFLYFLKASLVIAIFYCCFYFFFKKETFFNHNRWFLILGLIVALIFPNVVIPVYKTVKPAIESQFIYEMSQTVPETIVNGKIADQQINWLSIITLVYGIGFTLFLMQFFLQFGSLITLLVNHPKNKAGWFTYVIVKHNISPFSFFKWIVFNPESYSEEELKVILNHEKVHASQGHSFDIIFTQLMCVVFWFNPLVWLYRKAIKQNLEYIADYNAQKNADNQKKYQQLLLKTSVPYNEISISSNFYNSLIKKRIVMLNKSRSSNKKQWRSILIIPILAVLLLSMNTETIYIESDSFQTQSNDLKTNVLISSINTAINKTQTNISNSKNETLEIKFDKKTTDKQLEDIKSKLNSSGIAMSIKKIKRNSEGHITDINLKFEDNNGKSSSYSVNDTDGIQPFVFKKDKDTFGIISVHNKHGERKIHSISNSKVIIHKSDDKTDTIHFKSNGNNKEYVFFNDDDETIIVEEIDSAKIKRIVKGKPNIFFKSKKGDDVKIIKHSDVKIIKSDDDDTIVEYSIDNTKPLIIVNGEKVDYDKFELLDSDLIKSMNVIKGNSAIQHYGGDAENGVIVIDMKDGNFWVDKDKQSSNKVIVNGGNTSAYTFVYDEDEDIAEVSIINKNTSDAELEAHKKRLTEQGLKIKYSKKRRNKQGELTSIKITIENNEGDKSSAVYKNSDGISNIMFGTRNGDVFVKSRN